MDEHTVNINVSASSPSDASVAIAALTLIAALSAKMVARGLFSQEEMNEVYQDSIDVLGNVADGELLSGNRQAAAAAASLIESLKRV